MPRIKQAKNIANHVGIVLDASTSMLHLRHKVVEVADRQVKHLAAKSTEHKQETRISIWVFSGRGTISCVVWDMDVLRLPSIDEFYEPGGNTALIDAVIKSIDDLSTVSQIYGDHSFLMYVFTDGEENNSLIKDPRVLSSKIKKLPDNWTAAAFVPNVDGVVEAKRFGFPAGNIQMWDASSEKGLEEAAQSMMDSTDAFMTARATGLRSTTSLFDMSPAAVNKKTIKAAGLKPLLPGQYVLVPVPHDARIDDFTASMGHRFAVGRGYYQLSTRSVQVQTQKEIAVVEKNTGKVYVGRDARSMIGLPDMTVSIKAGYNPDYDIFVQSTSLNRKLLAGTKYLYLIG